MNAYIQYAYPIDYENPAEVSKKELLQNSKSSLSALKICINKNILQYIEKPINYVDNTVFINKRANELNENQKKALNEIQQQFVTQSTVLLHGVTSSGKTEIYINLIHEQLQQSKQVLYLLPEIALTTQIVNRLKNVFDNKVVVYNSHFNNRERLEIYNNLLNTDDNTEPIIVLGVRSSIFLPYTKLGLIIVDEEHENTYKQYDPAPRYNARDAAIILAQIHNAKTLLGTATPAIETYYNALTGKYGFVELNKRYNNMSLPVINIVDIKRARLRKQVSSHFSNVLLDKIHETITNGEQVILFQNRRGFAPFLMCPACAYIPRCKHCDVSLTYHKHDKQLICHYCGYKIGMQNICPQCGDTNMQTCGFGTEKVEEELRLIFPDALIERLDLDTTRRKKAYEHILKDFEDGKIDILVGTQMLTKGFDFDNVTLAGVLNADNMLNFPDFRAYERSYQLMSQVGGRAGRKNKQGLVLIQTVDADNPIIRCVQEHDYLSMYNLQIAERKEFIYPPFCRLLVISLKHTDKNIITEAAVELKHRLKAIFGKSLAGPETPLVERVKNKYLLNFRLKLAKNKSAQNTKILLHECINNLMSLKKEYRSLKITVDVDPM
jgi:primosomal protein N' (replication factor Y)